MKALPELNADTAKATVKTAAASLKSASSLIAKQAERTKLVTVTLPRAYAELGKATVRDSRLRDEFKELAQSVDTLIAQRKKAHDEAYARSAGTTIAEKAKKAVSDATAMAKTKAIDLQTYQALARFGQAVYEKYGNSAGPVDLTEPIAKAIARREQLDRETAQINQQAQGGWVTPKRIVWGGGSLIAFLLIGSTIAWLGGGKGAPINSEPGGDGYQAASGPSGDNEGSSLPPLVEESRTQSSGSPTQSAYRKPTPYKAESLPLNDAIVSLVKADSKSPGVYFVWRDPTGEISISDLAASWIWRGGEIEREDPSDWQNTQRVKGPVKIWRPTGNDTVTSLTEWLKPYSASRGNLRVPIRASRMSVDGTDFIIVMASAYDKAEAEAAAQRDASTPIPTTFALDVSGLSENDRKAYLRQFDSQEARDKHDHLRGLMEKEDRKKRESTGSLPDSDAVLKAVRDDLRKRRG